ncbi:PAP/OAS1 substrate-binding domain-containing protein, partial [Polychaeton citri CBS 116435]
QAAYLQDKADQEVRLVEISESERRQKETFLTKLQGLCEILCEANPSLPKVTLECFGSFKSGFASAGSDMDVAIVLKGNLSESTYISLDEAGLPRSLEKMLLENAIGARLLDKTRVPIIQVCEAPDDETLAKLTQNRKDWEDSPVEHKYPHLFKDGKKQDDQDEIVADAHELKSTSKNEQAPEQFPAEIPNERIHMEQSGKDSVPRTNSASPTIQKNKPIIDPVSENGGESTNTEKEAQSQPKRERPWTRERKKATMDFPKEGVGIQCDINFFNPLGIHNTKLLRCYSSCDPRVRPMILFIKAWAKRRKINSSYSGTLSSYGYVLMVLHYLVNITKPPVLPNLQRQLQVGSTFFEPGRAPVQVGEWVVDFCQDEIALLEAARSGQLTKSNEPLGSLLAGFFHYYAAQGGWRPDQSFFWKDSVLSLRSPGGILSKEDKGWTRLVTEEVDGKEVRHRYLFAIEDPFELRHNVARTVGHQGIVAVRDEFRRAHRILLDAGNSRPLRDGELLDPFVDPEE